jgi:hypothetical protein
MRPDGPSFLCGLHDAMAMIWEVKRQILDNEGRCTPHRTH